MIDLFKLHSNEDTPNGWIKVSLKLNIIKSLYSDLLQDYTQKEISKIISTKLNCGESTIGKHLIKINKSKNKVDLPIPLVIELNELSGKNRYHNLNKSIIYIRTTYKAQKVKPLFEINETLAKIIGAHISDGYLQKYKGSYAWKVSEGRKETVFALRDWIREYFGFSPVVWCYKKQNMWVCSSKNKVFCRFLEKIIELPIGKKSYTIREPEIIKKCSMKIRNAFLSGMLNFDGCVKTNGIVSLTSMSQGLIMDAKDILKINGLITRVNYNDKKGSWILETTKSRDKNELNKLLSFFETNTYKYNRLKFLLDEDTNVDINSLIRLFPEERLSKTSLSKVYSESKKLGEFKAIELANKCNVNKTTLYKYLHILYKSNLLDKYNEQIKTNKNAYITTTYKYIGK